MVEHELLFLGLLVDGPKHGYEIKRQIQEELSHYIGLSIKSIYYPLKKMQEEGLVEQEKGRKGLFPEKFIYRLTARGRKRFDELIDESFVSIERPFFQIDLSLYFLHLADRTKVKKRLKVRLNLLKKIARDLITMKEKSQGSYRMILDHNLALVQAELISTERLIQGL